MIYYTEFEDALCSITLVGDSSGLKILHMNTQEGPREFIIDKTWIHNHNFFNDVIKQLQEYFKGTRQTFNIKLNPQGTDYQKTVWNALLTIPYGETRSYKDIAVKIGNEKGARSVGAANGKNPIPIIIPCHRVIGKNGKLTGFAFGTTIKEKLIKLEKK